MALHRIKKQGGQVLIELLVAVGASVILVPTIFSGFIATREGRVQRNQRLYANTIAEGTIEAVRVVREASWINIATNGTYHPVVSGNSWALSSGSDVVSTDFTRSVDIASVSRDSSGNIVTSGGTVDPATKKITATVAWTAGVPNSVISVTYLTSFANHPNTQTTSVDFNAGILTQAQVVSVSGGEVKLANNNKAKWCSPDFTAATIDLPDGPPVALTAFANAASSAVPNDVLVAVSPTTASSIKMAYVNVTANTDPPTTTLKGTFTLDPTKYSAPGLVPTGIGLTNSFKTNDIKYYKSTGNKVYALIATDLPDKEVIAIQLHNGVSDSWQDPTNKIFKYHTFFNTRMYQGNSASTPNQDRAPFNTGAVSLSVLENRAYILSSGFMYVIDLSNIDSKTTASGLDMVGCRIELDGYDCSPGTNLDKKYDLGETGATWGNTTAPAHISCADGGNIELYSDNHMAPVKVGANYYVNVAVGAGTNPELDIVNVTTVPTASTTPKISQANCGSIANGAAGWKRISSLDFNSSSGTEEAANSVYVKSDGSRVYISSNGGIDGNGNGQPDSKQFYIVNTSNKSSPAFLSGTPATGATSGFYNGDSSNIQLFPRRSLTVLNGQRAILVGQDGFSDAINPKDYQVLNIETEATPIYCSGLDFDLGFNDLTSVSEADLDNFVYLVANTNVNELKIIQGGPDSGIYIDSGTLESKIFDSGNLSTFNSYQVTQTVPTGTTMQYQVAIVGNASATCSSQTYSYFGPDGTSGTYFTATSGSIPFSKSSGRCFRYKAFLGATDTNQTPQLLDFTVNYSP